MSKKADKPLSLDTVDLEILKHVQSDCKRPLHAIGDLVGLSAPSVMERIRKLEQAGVIVGYSAKLNARTLGFAVTAFVQVQVRTGPGLKKLLDILDKESTVQECHLVSGRYNLLLKLVAPGHAEVQRLTDTLYAAEDVLSVEVNVALSTSVERNQVALSSPAPALRAIAGKKPRRNATVRSAQAKSA